MKKHVNGFVSFVREQGVVGLAVGLAIGTAAGSAVKAIVDGFINPIVGFILGGADLGGQGNRLSEAAPGHPAGNARGGRLRAPALAGEPAWYAAWPS